ncbi:MAG: LysM peptidoglycan-binding domain-containing protein [Alphaproteobacteria bacterium]|nr:LysM peptidoglycan-binding domain-containing protein [Alphaproteobacteria bacterium]
MLKRDKSRFAQIGKVKKSTEEIVNDAVARQGRISRIWHGHRPAAKSAPVASTNARIKQKEKTMEENNNQSRGWKAYWFPILCAIIVLILIIWVILIPRCGTNSGATPANPIPEPTVKVVSEANVPEFDIVRIEKEGRIVIGGRYLPNSTVSITLNKKIIATEKTNSRGEFAHGPTKPLAPGNYTLRLVAVDKDVASVNNVFLYISPRGFENSVSLLMTDTGSKLLQAPVLSDGDLIVQKIDYLENGRIMVQGKALPRLRVTLSLDDQELGFARTSDHKNFGLGAPVEKLSPGREYKMAVKMHDGEGKIVAVVQHKFVMPAVTPGDETYYTVRQGDALWIISRNFLGRGALYTLIVEKNNIKNPNLIHPKQVLQIPIKGK